MKGKTLLPLTLLITGSLALSACGHHENPLLTQNKKDVLLFIKKAEVSAGNKTKMYAMIPGYPTCLSNPAHFDTLKGKGTGIKRCKDYFNAMVDYAKTTQKFKALTAGDLNDKAVQKRFGGTTKLSELLAV